MHRYHKQDEAKIAYMSLEANFVHFLDSFAFKTEGIIPEFFAGMWSELHDIEGILLGIFHKNVVRIVRLFLHFIFRTDIARHKRVSRCSEHTNAQQQKKSTEYTKVS